MAGKHTNQERPEQKRSQSGMNQGNRPSPGGTRDQGDPSRDSRSREASRDSQSSQRATHGQDMTRGSGGSKRPGERESEDVDRDKRRSSSERERKESH